MRLNLLILCLLLISTAPIYAAKSEQVSAVVTYSSNPATLLVSYGTISPELASQDTSPTVRVYANGLVHIHYPVYLKQAGDYEMYLDPGELEALLGEITPILMSFNKNTVRTQKNEADYQQVKTANNLSAVEVFILADADISVFELNVKSYQLTPGNKVTKLNAPLKLSWAGLADDARHYQQLASIQALNQVANRLLELTSKAKLQTAGVQP